MVRRVTDMVAISALPPPVSPSLPATPRELLERGRPLFVSAVALAAERISAADLSALRSACEQMCDPSPTVRAAAYRAILRQIGEASGSRFHRAVIAAIVAEFGDLLERGIVHDMNRYPDWGSSDLDRLCEALESGSSRLAAQAAEDHLLVVGQILDQVMAAAD